MTAAAMDGVDILDILHSDNNDMQIYKIYRRKLQHLLKVRFFSFELKASSLFYLILSYCILIYLTLSYLIVC